MKIIVWVLPLLISSVLAGGNLLSNGSFERRNPDGTPADWHFYVMNQAESSMKVSPDVAADGASALHITNRTPITANVYGALEQSVPVSPGTRYRLTLLARGGRLNSLQIAMGKQWKIRFPLNELTPEWRPYVFEFTPRADQLDDKDRLPLVILCDGVTTSSWIDDIQLTPAAEPCVHGVIVPAADLGRRGIARSASGPIELPAAPAQYTGKTLPDRRDLFAVAEVGGSDSRLDFHVDVTDQSIRTSPDSSMWNGDCVQIRIDSTGTRRDEPLPTDLEIGFAPAKEGIRNWCWTLNRPLTSGEMSVTGGRTAAGYSFDARIHWAKLPAYAPKHGVLSFNFVVNDSDGPDDRRIAFLAPGLHEKKSSRLNRLLLLEKGEPHLAVLAEETTAGDRFKGELYLSGFESKSPWTLNAQLTGASGKSLPVTFAGLRPVRADEVMRIFFDIGLESIADGDFSIRFSGPSGLSAGMNGRKANRLAEQKAEFSRLRREFDAIRTRAAKRGTGAYLTLFESVIARQLDLAERDLAGMNPADEQQKHYYLSRGETILIPELREALARYRDWVARPDLPRGRKVVTSQQRVAGGWPVELMRNDDGKTVEAPAYLGGYGHFPNGLRPDMKNFSDMGGNIVHIELGPSGVFPREGKKGEFSDPDLGYLHGPIFEIMRLAREHNQKVLLLVSPHYAPDWWRKKHPEAMAPSGFLPYDVNHPESRKLMTAYLDVLLKEVAKSPYRDTLHSICLSNEPVYTGADPKREFSRREFEAYLAAKFGSVAAFNRESGKHYASLDAVARSAAEGDPVAAFEFELYRRKAFADWHKWMAEKVRSALPEVPVESKIMVFFTVESRYLRQGVDPELFAEFSDFNGNDNYMFYRQGYWAADWQRTAFYHDLQYALKPVAIVNGENHVIPDGDRGPIPYDHIYTATFQQYLSGVSGLLTWLWDDMRYDNPSTLHGNISRRPGAILAQGMATLDANRLAPELLAFRRAPVELALLYSPTALLRTPEAYSSAVHALYEQLAFTGHPVTFLSEKQLAADKFRSVRVLLIPDAVKIDRAAWQGIRRFAEQGGRVLYTGSRPEFDQYDRRLSGSVAMRELRIGGPGHEDIPALRKLLAALVSPCLLPVESDSPEGMRGIYWRSVPYRGGELINLVNYNLAPRTIRCRIPAGFRLIDLIAEKEKPAEFPLEPLQPQFMYLCPENSAQTH